MSTVFFDIDRTLVKETTAFSMLRHYVRSGFLSWWYVVWGVVYALLHFFDLIDGHTMMRRALKPFAGMKAQDILDDCRIIFDRRIRRNMYAEALDIIARHQKQGHRVVLLTATSKYLTIPIAEHLGLDYIASDAVLQDGRFTTRLKEPIPYHEGKLVRAKAWLDTHGGSLEDCWFYTDSHSDMPLLQAVGHPQVVNPDVRLGREAARRGGPVHPFVTTQSITTAAPP